MTHNTDPSGIDAGHALQQAVCCAHVRDLGVVAALIALHLDTCLFGPPVKDERRRDNIAVVGKALRRGKREIVVLNPGVTHR